MPRASPSAPHTTRAPAGGGAAERFSTPRLGIAARAHEGSSDRGERRARAEGGDGARAGFTARRPEHDARGRVPRVAGADAARARARRRIVRVDRARGDARERSPFRALRVRAERRRDRREGTRARDVGGGGHDRGPDAVRGGRRRETRVTTTPGELRGHITAADAGRRADKIECPSHAAVQRMRRARAQEDDVRATRGALLGGAPGS